ncbi:MAG: response regulator [Acidobacteriota bacterium]
MQQILLVEDNEMNRDLISRRLKRRGFDVSIAVDGAEGVEKATADHPDLIVMDMGLPVLDGYEATRMLKGADATRRIPIIGLSAHAMSGDARKALAAGCDDYDTKPVEWARLLGKIDTLLTRAKEEASLSQEDSAVPPEATVNPDAAHLLVVDDSAMHRQMLSDRLGSLGHKFDLVGDASSALEKLQQGAYDAVLLDVTLPPIEGQPLLEHLQAGESTRDLPIIMLSTIDAVPEAIACLGRGAVDFIAQPFQVELLATRIEMCLERTRAQQRIQQLEEALGAEQRRSEHLLGTLLPASIVGELRETRKVIPRRCPAVALLFCDVAGFRKVSDNLDPQDSIRRLQQLIVAFEEVVARHSLEKVKTVGDSFMAAAGLFASEANPASALSAVRCGLEMIEVASGIEESWPLRIGVHHGSVVAGVVGHRKCQFDLWGDAVQTAARVKAAGPPGSVSVSETVWREISGQSQGQRLGETQLKGDATVMVYQVTRVESQAII